MTSLQIFNSWFNNSRKSKPVPASLPIEKKWFLSEMSSFYTLAGTINKTWSDKDFEKFEVRELSYPLIRRLLETYFRILYIFDDITEISERMDRYSKHIAYLYTKSYNELDEIEKDLKNKGWLEKSYLSTLPITNKGKKDSIFNNVKSMLEQIKSITGGHFGSFYMWYRITSFYSHGNINKEIWDTISLTNNNFPIIRVSKLIEKIAEDYNERIKDLRLK